MLTEPLDKENKETIIKRTNKIAKDDISLIFFKVIFSPHLIMNNYYKKKFFFK